MGVAHCQSNKNGCHCNQINGILGKMAVLKTGDADLHIHTKIDFLWS